MLNAAVLPSAEGVKLTAAIAKVLSGAWAIGEDVEGTGGTAGAKVWRFEMVNGTGVHAEAVFIRLRYIDTYSNTGVRTAVSDLGNGYLTATGTRTISQNTALNLKVLLGLTSLVALMKLVTSLPSPGDANWGEFYGLSDTAGRVEDVYYRREVETTILDWRVERLSSTNRNLHGYAQVARGGVNGYSAGGSLFPSDEGIEELIEEQDTNGNVTIRAVVNDGGLLQSGISLILFYDLGDGGYEFSTAREEPLFHDASYTVAGQRRYVSAVATDFRFTPGRRYGLKWRNAGQAHDLVLSEGNHLVAVADHDDLESVRSELLADVYGVEDRVAALEAGPATGSVSRHALFMPAASYAHRSGGALYFAGGESIWTIPYPAGTTFAGLSASFKTVVLQADAQHTGIADVGVTANEANATELWGTHTMGGGTGFRIVLAAAAITLAIPSSASLPTNERDGWIVRLSVVA